MGMHTQRGFTIIELILVVAVTGLMTAALLVGTGASINTQRYRDAVQTLRTTLQDQYSEVSSVRNDRSNTYTCDSGAQVNSTAPNVGTIRGQSDCILLGRLITIDAKAITTHSILGVETAKPEKKDTDLSILKDKYKLNSLPEMTETDQLEWGTEIAWAKSGVDAGPSPRTGRKISILFITSPTSGQVYTFTSDELISVPSPTNLKKMIDGGNKVPGRAERVICIESSGLVTAGATAIYIAPKAASATAIESRVNELLVGKASC
jgi:prepilin-type N-terminal cleavage/methylation domain-containing protein